MPHAPAIGPALSIALALAAGMLVQAVARHLRVPGIVLLLAAGVLLGPDGADVVRPDTLGSALQILVGFAVAVILFEGGLSLNLRQLRREARSIRQLVTVGALVTALGGAITARLVLGWSLKLSILFGTLVIVTGPTVITPLLRRIKVERKVATVLEAEGVFGDAIGALIAVVALEVALNPISGESLASGLLALLARLGFGAVMGLAGGLVIAFLLRFDKVVPEGLENVFTLCMVLALYQGSSALLAESGIVTVILAGLVVGNGRARVLGELKSFKEQLTLMFIGVLFVLLAADVRIDEVRRLGWPGVWTVVVLMLVVRPANVLAGTAGSDLTRRQKAFLAWLAPRGIVAAAVSSLFAQALDEAGIEGGEELRAMVFLVIAVTVLVQGLTGGLVARLLGVRQRPTGYVLLGANDLGRAMGALLRDGGEEVVFLDSNPDACRAAEEAGFRVLYGSALEESVLLRAELDGRKGCLAVTANDEVNLFFARTARKDYKVPQVWAALRRGHLSVREGMLRELGAHTLFAKPRNVELWTLRLEEATAEVERWRRSAADEPKESPAELELILLPMALHRAGETLPVDETTAFRRGDELSVALFTPQGEAARAQLAAAGWEPAAEEPPAARAGDREGVEAPG